MGRLWHRYGEKTEIGEIVIQEIEAAYPEERLEEIIRNLKKDKLNNYSTWKKNFT